MHLSHRWSRGWRLRRLGQEVVASDLRRHRRHRHILRREIPCSLRCASAGDRPSGDGSLAFERHSAPQCLSQSIWPRLGVRRISPRCATLPPSRKGKGQWTGLPLSAKRCEAARTLLRRFPMSYVVPEACHCIHHGAHDYVCHWHHRQQINRHRDSGVLNSSFSAVLSGNGFSSAGASFFPTRARTALAECGGLDSSFCAKGNRNH